MLNKNRSLFIQVIAAEGEQKASHALKEAAMVIQESSSALQVRCSEFIITISKITYFRNCLS